MSLGEKVRQSMLKNDGMTNKKLAELIGVSPQAISNMIRNNIKLSNNNMIKLSHELNMPLDFFIDDSYVTVDEYELTNTAKTMMQDNNMVEYIVFADKLKKQDVSIEQLEEALQLIMNIRKAKETV